MPENPFDDFALEMLHACARLGMEFPMTLHAVCSGGVVTVLYRVEGEGIISKTVIRMARVGSEPFYGVFTDQSGRAACFNHGGIVTH